MTKYCLGFAFDNAGKNVVLIRKNKPEWQAGKLNGIGGKIEELETTYDAMSREFYEETGLITLPTDWLAYLYMYGPGFRVHTFLRFNDDAMAAKTMTDEEVFIAEVKSYHHFEHIRNLPWLISAALDEQARKGELVLEAEYRR
jgi:8-oxo-dGTP diphosphatase